MKKLQLLIMAFLIAGFIGGTAGPAAAMKNRQQLKRIYNGIRKGSITPDEFMKLNQEMHRIRDYRMRALSDGYISPKERRKLNRMLNKADRHIYRANNNRKSIKGRAYYGYRH